MPFVILYLVFSSSQTTVLSLHRNLFHDKVGHEKSNEEMKQQFIIYLNIAVG